MYESRLLAHESVASHLLVDLKEVKRHENTTNALVLIDTDGCDMTEMVLSNDDSVGDEESKANEGEANIVCQHVTELIKQNVKPEEIAVITPYNLQMELIRAKLHTKYPQVEVKSVDGFQGREKEAVVLSMVRSNSRGEVGFLADERRINVAITRARRHLCVVCDRQTCKNNQFLKSFLDYCEKYADVRSGFDYVNEELNEGMDFEFEDITFKKLKISDKKPQPKTAKAAQPIKEPVLKSKTLGKVIIESSEDKEFDEAVKRIIESIKTHLLPSHSFPTDLNARQRRIVHELAEQHGICHLSRGENEQRYIMLSMKPIEESAADKPIEKVQKESHDETDHVTTSKSFEVLNETDTGVETKTKKKKKNKKEPIKTSVAAESKKSIEKEVNLLGELDDQEDSHLKFRNDVLTCPHCNKYILKLNFLMHEMHCSKINSRTEQHVVLEASKKVDQSKKATMDTTATTTTSKVKQNPIEAATTNDFDELIELFQKSNNVCNFKGCKTLVKTLGQNCEYCPHRFCLQHSLAEVI